MTTIPNVNEPRGSRNGVTIGSTAVGREYGCVDSVSLGDNRQYIEIAWYCRGFIVRLITQALGH